MRGRGGAGVSAGSGPGAGGGAHPPPWGAALGGWMRRVGRAGPGRPVLEEEDRPVPGTVELRPAGVQRPSRLNGQRAVPLPPSLGPALVPSRRRTASPRARLSAARERARPEGRGRAGGRGAGASPRTSSSCCRALEDFLPRWRKAGFFPALRKWYVMSGLQTVTERQGCSSTILATSLAENVEQHGTPAFVPHFRHQPPLALSGTRPLGRAGRRGAAETRWGGGRSGPWRRPGSSRARPVPNTRRETAATSRHVVEQRGATTSPPGRSNPLGRRGALGAERGGPGGRGPGGSRQHRRAAPSCRSPRAFSVWLHGRPSQPLHPAVTSDDRLGGGGRGWAGGVAHLDAFPGTARPPQGRLAPADLRAPRQWRCWTDKPGVHPERRV